MKHGYDAIMVVVDCLFQMCSCHTDNIRCYGVRSGLAIQSPHLETPWTPEEVIVTEKPNSCQLHGKPQPTLENQNHSFRHLSPADGQPDGAGQPGSQSVSTLFVNQCQDNWDKWLSMLCSPTMTGSIPRCNPPLSCSTLGSTLSSVWNH